MSQKRRKPPTLEELLCDQSLSNIDILTELERVESDEAARTKLLSSEAARDALAARLTQGCKECVAIAAAEDAAAQPDLLQAHLNALRLLVALMPGEPADKLARVLLHGSKLLDAFDAVLSCISHLCQQCSVGPSSPKEWSLSVSPKELQDTLGQVGRDVLAVVQDMACYMYTATVSTQATQPGATQNGGAQRGTFGREQCGNVLLGSILEMAAMDLSLSERFYALRRSAVSSLVAIASHSRRNQISLLTNHADSYSRLMRDVLAGCGDADTQVDLFEIMYRCSKVFNERAYHHHLDAQMHAKFVQLLALDAPDVGDLREALTGLVADFNSSQQEPSVHHIHANQMKILSPLRNGLTAPGTDVSLGVGHMSLEVELLQEVGSYTETCDIEYSNILRVMVEHMGSNGRGAPMLQVQVDVQCKALPASLGQEVEQIARDMQGGTSPFFRLGMLMEPGEGDRLMHLLRAQSVAVVLQSATTAEPSQPSQTAAAGRPRKVSMGNMPVSYMAKKPLPLTKTTPATDDKVKPLALFKTPGAEAAAGATAGNARAAATANVAATADAGSSHVEDEQSPVFGRAAVAAPAGANAAAAAANAHDLVAAMPTAHAAADGAASKRESQMLQALLQTAQELPNMHTGPRPTLSSSLMAGNSPDAAAGPAGMLAAAAARGMQNGDEAAVGGGKETAPAATLAAAGGAKKQQRQAAAGRGKQQQHQEDDRQKDGVSWDAATGTAGQQGDEVQRQQQQQQEEERQHVQEVDNLQSNSQEAALDASPAARVKARRRSNTQTAAAAPAAAADSKRKAGGKVGGKQGADNTAAAAGQPPAGPNKPPAGGRGKKAAERKTPVQLERRSSRRKLETQDSIQDPDLPSLQRPAGAAAAEEEEADVAADMPAWFNAAAAAAAPSPAGRTAASVPVTTPYSSRSAQQAAAATAAAPQSAGRDVDENLAAAAATGSGGKKGSRLAKLALTETPQCRGRGRPPPAAAASEKAGRLPDAAAKAAAEDTVHDAFPDAAAAGVGKGQKGRQAAAGKAAAGAAEGKGRKAAAGAAAAPPPSAAAAAAGKAAQKGQQQQPQLSDFDFPVSSSDSDAEDDIPTVESAGSDSDWQGRPSGGRGGRGSRGGRGGRGRSKGRGGAAAAAKAGSKRKAAAAAAGHAAGNRQKQQRRGAAAEAAAAAAADRVTAEEVDDVVPGTVDDDTAPAHDTLAVDHLDAPTGAAEAAPGAAAAGAAGKKQRQRKQQRQQDAEAGGESGGVRRQPRASKSKALEAMQQQQQRVLAQANQLSASQQQQQQDTDSFGGFGDLEQPADQLDAQLQGAGGFDAQQQQDAADEGAAAAGGDADELIAGLLHSPTPSGAGAGTDPASDSGEDGVGQLQALLQARVPKPTTAHGRYLPRLLQGGQLPAAAAATPDALEIDTAKVALTGAAIKGTAGPQHASAAAAAAGLDSPLNTTTAAVGKRKAGAAAVGGFQLPCLATESPESSPAASERGGADAKNLGGAGLKLEGLGRSRQPGKGFCGLNGLGLGPGAAAAGAGDNDSEDDEAAAATRFKGLPVPVAAKKQQQRQPQHQQQGGGFAAALDDDDDEGAGVGRRGEGGLGLEGSSEEDTALVAQLLAKALAGKDDEDGDEDSDDEDDDESVAVLQRVLLHYVNRRKAADRRRAEREFQELESGVRAQVAECQAQIKKEFSTLAVRGNTQAEKMLGALEAKASELAATHERAKLELQEQWEQYRAIYEKACSMHQALHAAQERGVALHKRRLSELQQGLLARVSTKEQELASKRARADTHFRQMMMLLKAAQ